MWDKLGTPAHFDEQEKNYLKERIRKTIGFIRKKNIKTVVIAGYSGVYARDFLIAAWKRLHPNEEMPKFYSFGKSPELTMGVSRRHLWDEEGDWNGSFTLFKNSTEKRMPSLLNALNEPILVFDEMTGTENTLRNTASLLKKLGATAIHTFPLVDCREILFTEPMLHGRGKLRVLLDEEGRRKVPHKTKVDENLKRIKLIKGELRKLAREL